MLLPECKCCGWPAAVFAIFVHTSWFVGNKTVCHMKGGRGSGSREGGGSKVEHVQKSI
jgi:hypothetical protein